MRLLVFVVAAMLLALSCPEPSSRWDWLIGKDSEFGPHIEPSGEDYSLHFEAEEGDSDSDDEPVGGGSLSW